MNRWTYTIEQRKYKCSQCLCLMGVWVRCLNDKCPSYVHRVAEVCRRMGV